MSSRTPIFVLCCARSGSTLLRYALDAHPALCAPPELHLLATARQLAWLHTHTGNVPGSDDTASAAARDAVAETRRHLDRIMGGYCARENKSAWCEKSVSSIDHLDVLDAVFPDARIVSLHRDPLDVVASCLEVLDRHAGGFGFEAYVARHPGAPVTGLLEYWCDKTDAITTYRADASISIRYEDLVTRTSDSLAKLALGLGIDSPKDWADRVFSEPHRLGPGDPKILSSTGFDALSIGRGAALDLSDVPPGIVDRARRLAEPLGYEFPNV